MLISIGDLQINLVHVEAVIPVYEDDILSCLEFHLVSGYVYRLEGENAINSYKTALATFRFTSGNLRQGG